MKKNYKFDAMSALQKACIDAVANTLRLAEYYEEKFLDDTVKEWATNQANEAREMAAAMENIITELFGA